MTSPVTDHHDHAYSDADLERFRVATFSWLSMQEANIERRWNTDQKGLLYATKDYAGVIAALGTLGLGFKVNVVGNPTATFAMTDEVTLMPEFVKSPHASMTGLNVVLSPMFQGSKARDAEKGFLETLAGPLAQEEALAAVRGGKKTAKYYNLLKSAVEERYVSGPRDLKALGLSDDRPLTSRELQNVRALLADFWTLRDALFVISGPIEH